MYFHAGKKTDLHIAATYFEACYNTDYIDALEPAYLQLNALGLLTSFARLKFDAELDGISV